MSMLELLIASAKARGVAGYAPPAPPTGDGVFDALTVTPPFDENGVSMVHNGATDALAGSPVDTTYALPSGTVRRVTEQGSPAANTAHFHAQQAAAVRGDMIVVDPIEFAGKLVLRDWGPGTTWVYYMPAAEYNRATGTTTYGTDVFPVAPPVAGNRGHRWSRRVPMSALPMMPRLYQTTRAVATAGVEALGTTKAQGCSYVRVIGFEVTTNPAWSPVTGFADLQENLVSLGYSGGGVQDTTATMGHHIIVDRCIVHCQPGHGAHHAFEIATEYTAVIGSRVIDTGGIPIGQSGGDCQAIAVDNSRGHILLEGNEASGGDEIIMVGAIASGSAEFQAPMADVVIRGNWIHHETDGTHPIRSKNCVEFKGCVRFLVEENVISHYRDGLHTYAVVVKATRQSQAPWNTTAQGIVRYNYLHDVCGAFSYSGLEDQDVGPRGTDVVNTGLLSYNNLVVRVNKSPYTGGVGVGQIGGWTNLRHEHWTVLDADVPKYCILNTGLTNPVVGDSIIPYGLYAYDGALHDAGVRAFADRIPSGYTWHPDAFYGTSTYSIASKINVDHTFKSSDYPAPHLGFAAQADIGFNGTGYQLDSASILKGAASDGRDRGIMNWVPFDSDLSAVES